MRSWRMVRPISVCRHSFMVWPWGLVSKPVHHTFAKGKNTVKTCVTREDEKRGSQTRSLCLIVVGWLLQNHRKCDASRVLGHLLLALGLMYASSFLPSAGHTLELYILVGISSPVSVDHPTLLFFFCNPSIAPNGEPNSRVRAREGCRATAGG
jgi:hypothetical protein